MKLRFEEHLKNILSKTNKTIEVLRKPSNSLPRQALFTIYQAFVRALLDHGDELYTQVFHNSFHRKMASIQYNVFLAITEAIGGTSEGKIYQELGLEYLQLCRW